MMATTPTPDERHARDSHGRPGAVDPVREPAPAVEGTIADGPLHLKRTPPDVPQFKGPRRPRSGRGPKSEVTRELPLLRVHGLTIRRVALIGGALAAMTLPLALGLPSAESLADVPLAELLPTMMVLKAGMVATAALFVTWRLAQRHGAARGTGYMLSVWTAALGFGILAARSHPNAGALVFDAGIAGVLLFLATDGRLRRRHSAH